MTAREWKPGDVAMVTTKCCGTGVAIMAPGNKWRGGDAGNHFGDDPTDVRPLVVIDPEDRARVERFVEAAGVCPRNRESWCVSKECCADRVQAALREFANPTPPKPDEPLSLGSLIEDESKRVWVRTGWATWRCISDDGIDARLWDDFSTVEVIR